MSYKDISKRKKHCLEYYYAHKEKMNAMNKEYYLKHKEKILSQHRAYHKKYDLKHRYGIDREFFNNLLLAQNNRCAICNKPFDLSNPKSIHIDHDHSTGKIRGILCRDCNIAIGIFKDNPEYAYNASIYLEGD